MLVAVAPVDFCAVMVSKFSRACAFSPCCREHPEVTRIPHKLKGAVGNGLRLKGFLASHSASIMCAYIYISLYIRTHYLHVSIYMFLFLIILLCGLYVVCCVLCVVCCALCVVGCVLCVVCCVLYVVCCVLCVVCCVWCVACCVVVLCVVCCVLCVVCCEL